MNKRMFGKTNALVTEIGLGTWQLGTKWGEPFNEKEAMKILETAYESGINFIDTADVYNGGDSEKAIGEFLKTHRDIYVTTKAGRQINPHTSENYTIDKIEKYIEESITRMGVEKLDMVLLHCPPTSVYKNDEIFGGLDRMKQMGKIIDYGVSIEKVSEGLAAMDYDISAMEVIFNMFRFKPLDELFVKTKENKIGVIARVPLASGLLSGKYTKDTTFGAGDHRTFNRDGAAFDKGETFSGVDYNLGLTAVEELKQVFGTDDLIPYAIKWIMMHDAVSVVIPGISKASQIASNVSAVNMPDLTEVQMKQVSDIYYKYIAESVHPLW